MPLYKTNLEALNRAKPLEMVLELASFAGGENTKGEDRALKNNEARRIKNWDALSIGGMIRSKGFTEVASGGATYTDALDLLIQHYEEGSGLEIYGVINGDLVIKNSASLDSEDASAFTTGILCHAVSAPGGKLWITNSTDNLKYKSIGSNITVPPDLPTVARDRIYYHKFRLIAEGGGKTIYCSRVGSAYWTAADAWSLANDACNIDLPDNTKGGVEDFPYGNEFLVFTYFGAYSLYNFPDIAYRQLLGSKGCAAPYSIAKGDEGIYFLSNYPTLCLCLFNGTQWIDLTINCDFVNDINLDNRIFGCYRNNKYYFLYNETGSGVNYPNRLRIYDALYGRWMERPVNVSLADYFGYPCLLKHSNNEIYFGSSVEDKVYEFETELNSDDANNTEADYKTKDFSSIDFSLATGGSFPIDEVRMKLLKFTLNYYGTKGEVTVQWTSDRGLHSGSQTVDLTAEGDLINYDFIVNTSYLAEVPPDKVITKSFNNAAVGRRFNFQILNTNTGDRPKIKSLKIHAIALEEY